MLRLENISITLSGAQILQQISLEFRRGEFTVLLGASGAGKSTLMRCLNLLNHPNEGKIFAEDLGDLSDKFLLHEHRKRTAFIFQQHQLIGRSSALANTLIGRLGYHATWRTLFPLPVSERKIALEALERVELLHKALERVDKLSGGQQQRVGIARALAQKPRLILADEPVASLDPSTADKVIRLMRRICDEDGITTVVSLHQLDLARRYANRIIGLADGRVVFDGPPGALSDAILNLIYKHGTAVPPSESIDRAVNAVPEFATSEICS